MEIKPLGFIYTLRRRAISTHISKVLVNNTCLNQFLNIKALSVSQHLSDHNPIILDLIPTSQTKGYPFIFNNEWPLHEGYVDCIHRGWQATTWGSQSYQFINKLVACKT